MSEISILIGGKAGDGIKQAANTIARLLGRQGYNIFFYDDYPSLIRGGHNFSIIRASESDCLCHEEEVEIIVALNQDTVDRHIGDLRPGGVIIYDKDNVEAKGIGVPMDQIVKEHSGIPIMRNTAAIGALGAVLDIGFESVEEIIGATVKKALEVNIAIARKAYDSIERRGMFPVPSTGRKALPLVTGNEAIALGAVRGGLDLYIAYPMTPASSILHFLADHGERLGVTTVHPESEIGAALMVIGAAYGGKRAMTGTSGGGFALMTEAISLSAQSETPIVIVECQRTGPSTGVPTYTMQADLKFCLGAGHGDVQRIVMAPGDAVEAYEWSYHALNAAWYFQVPVLLLSDKHLSESAFSFKEPGPLPEWPGIKTWEHNDGPYKRYVATGDGISPMAFPGTKGATVKATSYEHDEYGITVEDAKAVQFMQEKRLRKARAIRDHFKGMKTIKEYGPEDSDVVLIFWGSTKGAAVEACKDLGIRSIQPIVLEPFPEEGLKSLLGGARKVLCAETNATGQLSCLLRCYGIEVHETILRYDGRPFTPKGLKKAIEEALR